MIVKALLASALATSLLVPAAFAQSNTCGYEPNIGNPLGLGDDAIGPGLALGFNFTFPDGTVTSTIDVDSNGRVLLPGGTSDYSPSIIEFLTDPSSICPYWDDLNPTGTNADDVYFNALPGKAVITWHDIVVYGGSDPFTIQCTLWADGRTWFVYDDRTPAQNCFVGMSVGNGAADPGPLDYSLRPFPTTAATFYEQFSAFDLADQLVEAINLTSNYILTDGSCASVGRIGQTGMPVFSMLFVPDGSGGYNISQATSGTWNSAYGTSLGLTDDSLSLPQALGFSFNFPGGVATTDIEVDSNGRILVPGSDTSDLSPDLAELLNDTFPVLVPFWTDLNPAEGGDVLFDVSTGVPTVTWLGVPQYGTSTAHTFQVQLYPGDAIRFSYLNTSSFDPTSDNLMVGISGGNGAADPGESDFTAMLPIATAGGTVAYEYFDGSIPEFCDLTALPFSLDATSRPIIGTTFGMDVTNAPTASVAAFFLIGFSNPNQGLGSLGLGLEGAFLYSSAEVTVVVPVTVGTASFGLGIPNIASLAGGRMYFQSALVTPNANLIGVLFSNGLQATINVL